MKNKIRLCLLPFMFACTMSPLFSKDSIDAENTYYLNATQVDFIAAHPQLLAYIGQLQNGLTPQEITTQYNLTSKSQKSYLSHLEKLGLITRNKEGHVSLVFGTKAFSWKSTDERLAKTVGIEMTKEFQDKIMSKLMAGGKDDDFNQFTSIQGFRLTDTQLKELNEEIRRLREKYFSISIENKNKGKMKEKAEPVGFSAITLQNWKPSVFTNVQNIDF